MNRPLTWSAVMCAALALPVAGPGAAVAGTHTVTHSPVTRVPVTVAPVSQPQAHPASSRRVPHSPARARRAPHLPAPVAPFPHCPDLGYQVHLPSGETTSKLGYFDIVTSTFFLIKDLGIGVNAIGYSQTQNVFWAMNASPVNADRIIRIDSAGNVDDIGRPYDDSGPVPVQTVTGTVQNNRFYVHNKIDNHLLVIDVNPNSATLGKVIRNVALSRVSPGGGNTFLVIGDWDFNSLDGQLYSVEMQGPHNQPSVSRVIVKINPSTGAVTDVADLSEYLPDGRNYGAVYVENSNNVMYVSNNDVDRARQQSQTFGIQQLNPPVVVAYEPGPTLDVNDGADCLLATDYGDAPESYHTLHQDGGPAHIITVRGDDNEQLTIGAGIDAEPNGFPGPDVDGDDKSVPDANDEDGVADGMAVDPGTPRLTIPVRNTTKDVATLAGWIDRDRNGAFDQDERAVGVVAPGATSVSLTWSTGGLALGRESAPDHERAPLRALAAGLVLRAAPPTVESSTYLRLRLYPGQVDDPRPVGADFVVGGELEDHRIALAGLPQTGSSLVWLLLIGVGLVLCGGFAMALTRRRP